ncbi:MAG: 4Fe-4S binding protein [Thermodesulfovibrionales bacterium]|nr:4Fe-4S binding protein [Thermodesulfovibrionales bacterium]
MRRVRVLVAAAICIALLGGWLTREMLPGVQVDEPGVLKDLAPGIVFGAKGGQPPHYRAPDGTLAFNSHDVTPSIRGYAGPIKTLVVMGPDGVIRGIKIVSHKETPNFVHSMLEPGYAMSFAGKPVTDPFAVGMDLDAITRATVSVEALADTVRESSVIAARKILGMNVKSSGTGGRTASVGWIALLVLFALAVYAARMNAAQRVRDVLLVVSMVVVGFWLSSPFTALHLFNILLGRLSSDPLWLVIVAGTFASVLLSGRVYCGWLCPLGAIFEFAGRLPTGKWQVPVALDKKHRKMKYMVFAAMALVLLISGRPGYGTFEPYITLFSFNGTWLAWAIFAISVLASLRVSRFWCRYLCPAGAVLGLLSPVAPKARSWGQCPMGNPPSLPVEGGDRKEHASECIRCNACLGEDI